jgi:hypothetical protein
MSTRAQSTSIRSAGKFHSWVRAIGRRQRLKASNESPPRAKRIAVAQPRSAVVNPQHLWDVYFTPATSSCYITDLFAHLRISAESRPGPPRSRTLTTTTCGIRGNMRAGSTELAMRPSSHEPPPIAVNPEPPPPLSLDLRDSVCTRTCSCCARSWSQYPARRSRNRMSPTVSHKEI